MTALFRNKSHAKTSPYVSFHKLYFYTTLWDEKSAWGHWMIYPMGIRLLTGKEKSIWKSIGKEGDHLYGSIIIREGKA